MSESANPLKLFYCYAHKDKALRDALDSHLSSLKRQNLVEIWYDGQISAGVEWENEIDNSLESADIVLLLVSDAFLNSEFCYGREMTRALQRHEEGITRVIPIILRPVHWENAPFSKLQALPTEAKPVTSWINKDEAYKDIVRRLDGVVRELQTQTSRKTAEDWIREGEAHLDLKHYAEALIAFERAIQLNPNYALAYNNKGRALSRLKQYEEALIAYDQALRLDPAYAHAYNNKGVALRKLGRNEEAILACEEAIRLNPNYALAYKNKGYSLNILKRDEEANTAFAKAKLLD